MLPPNLDKEYYPRSFFKWKGDELICGHIEFEVPRIYPVEVCITIGYVSLEFRKEVWVRNMNLDIINLGAVANTQIMAEIIQ